MNIVNVLLSSTPTLRFSIEEVLSHSWFDDPQMKQDIEVLQKEIDLKHQNVRDENIIQPIKVAQVSDAVDKKRKLPFSVPEFLGKRLKA